MHLKVEPLVKWLMLLYSWCFVIIALNSFHVAISYALEAINTMTSFIMALIPLLLALIAASGGIDISCFFPSGYFVFNEY